MGRGNLRALAALAAPAAALVLVAGAAAGLSWTRVAAGTTLPEGSGPHTYLSVTRVQEGKWLGRLTSADRRAVLRLNLARTAAVAVFLDGLPCASNVAVTTLFRDGRKLIVRIRYTPPALGVGTCVRTSTPYAVLGVARRTLGKPLPTRVVVDARARV